jgi:hypothetical protein
MRFSTKSIAGIVAVVVATAYGVARWRGEPDDVDELALDPEHRTPTSE